MQSKKVESELFNLEKQYWQAIKNRDLDAALALTNNPCVVAGASGVSKVNRKSFEKIMKGAKHTLENFEMTEPKMHMLTDDVAVLAYKVHEDLTVDGKAVSIDASEASTWVRRDGEWQCALHSESLIGDPYGRDRSH